MLPAIFILACLIGSSLSSATASYGTILFDSAYAFNDASMQVSVSSDANPYVNFTFAKVGRYASGVIGYGSLSAGTHTLSLIIPGYQSYVTNGHVAKISLLYDSPTSYGVLLDFVSTSGSNPYCSGTVTIS